MLVNHNEFFLVFFTILTYSFTHIGLVCFVYFLVALFAAGVPGIAHPFSIAVECLGAVEILWYLLWFLPYKALKERPGPDITPLTRGQRAALFASLLDVIPDLPIFIRTWFSNAHLDEIYRDDVKSWLLWALWGKNVGLNSFGPENEELEEYIDEVERRSEIKIRSGRAGAQPIRLSFDPIRMGHRSLTYFAFMFWMDTFVAVMLTFYGYQYYAQPITRLLDVFPIRVTTLFSLKRSHSRELSYLYRPHKSKTHRPLVFIHGIGVGHFPYLLWMPTIPKDVGVIAIEYMPVSGRLCRSAMPSKEFAVEVRKILAQHQIDDFVYMGHSYGTLLARPLVDDEVVGPKMNSVILCDPVSLLLHLPQLTWNITRRQPKTAPEIEIWFSATDPSCASTMARRFHWQDHIMWRERLIGKRTTVILGSRDCVTYPDAVASYVYYGDVKFSANDVEEWQKTPDTWTGTREMELMYLWDRDHGQCLVIPSEIARVNRVIEGYSRLDTALVLDEKSGEVSGEVPGEMTGEAEYPTATHVNMV